MHLLSTLLSTTALLGSLTQARVELPDKISAVWFANWAQYRNDSYQFYPNNLTSIINDVDIVYYAFAFFCPNSSMFQPYWVTELNYCADKQPFDIIWIEPKDPEFYREIVEMKQTNSELKVVLSVGGWNFPSNYFSQMVSDEESRATFIKSAINITNTYGFDGIDIDWEYPGSLPRTDPVEIYCDKFHNVSDYGGTYNDPSIDAANFVTLMTELRNGLGENKLITFCGQANKTYGFDIEELVKQVDLINIMTYDYTVSATDDDTESLFTAPNEPLYPPRSARDSDIAQWSINQTVHAYLDLGAPANQLLVGIAYYGHTWYIPGMSASDSSSWSHYGIKTTKPSVDDVSNCCSDLKTGYGGSAGEHSLQCGFNGYYEIENAGFLENAIFDNETKTYISYIDEKGNDNWTPANTWINYQGIDSIKAVVSFGNKLGLRGAFGFDITIDSFENGEWTFDLTNQMVDCVKNGC